MVNDGTIAFGSQLHTLSIAASGGAGGTYTYTQSVNGTLSMKLTSTSGDLLTVASTATLDGTLTLTGSSLPTGTWTIITYASESGDFDTFNWPDSGSWAQTVGATDYDVKKT